MDLGHIIISSIVLITILIIYILKNQVKALTKSYTDEHFELSRANTKNAYLVQQIDSFKAKDISRISELNNVIQLRDLRIEALEETIVEKDIKINELEYVKESLENDLEVSRRLMEEQKEDYRALQELVDSTCLPNFPIRSQG